MQSIPKETFDVEIALTHTIVCAVSLAIQSLDQGHCELCHGFGGICRDIRHKEAELFGGFEMDMVKSRTAEQDGPDPVGMKGSQHALVQGVVDKDAHCVAILG
ncbi:unnamed protein product [Penicillium nalgiovense]|nr:unnamed protein product [Penicillium nalgiovense]